MSKSVTTAITAAERRRKIVTNDPSIYAMTTSAVSRLAPAAKSRSMQSAADLAQIKARQDAEALPEGQVRRKRGRAY